MPTQTSLTVSQLCPAHGFRVRTNTRYEQVALQRARAEPSVDRRALDYALILLMGMQSCGDTRKHGIYQSVQHVSDVICACTTLLKFALPVGVPTRPVHPPRDHAMLQAQTPAHVCLTPKSRTHDGVIPKPRVTPAGTPRCNPKLS